MNPTCDITPEYLAAGDVNASSTLLHHLADSSRPCVRAQVASNSATPLQALARLLNDKVGVVRAGLADNPAVPTLFLQQLAVDDDDDVRYELADNASMPRNILQMLASDPNPYVAHRAKKTLDRLARERELRAVEKPLQQVAEVQLSEVA